MSDSFPRITGVRTTRLSPWASLVEKTVVFEDGAEPEVYHCLTQADYVSVLAIDEHGCVPIVRQFRPAVGGFTWELPAGTVDVGEAPEASARRELMEETGCRPIEVISLGTFLPDTGRLQVESHAFFARVLREGVPVPDPRLEVRWVPEPELRRMIRDAEFRHQIHLAVYATALLLVADGGFLA